MANKKYIRSNSNFTVKTKHQTINGGTVFERDAMTISNFNGLSSEQTPIYGDGNFKLTVRGGLNKGKKFKYGKWVKASDGSEIWTLNNSETANGITSDSKIVVKPNYNSLLDFAYYGSCLELIKNSITNITEFYPAELYITDAPYYYLDKDGNKAQLGGGNMVVVNNPLAIDIITASIIGDAVKNKLRYFCESYNNYSIITPDESTDVVDWNVVQYNTSNKCLKDGDKTHSISINNVVMERYFCDNKFILVTNKKNSQVHIRPKQSFINEFYNSLDSFQTTLLNKDTQPKFRATFETPVEMDLTIFLTKRDYIYPTDKGDWNILADGEEFNSYVTELYQTAVYFDNAYSNNIWRSLIHDSIKDLTLNNTYAVEGTTEIKEGAQKIEKLMYIIGYMFDYIKTYIDNIKNNNTVTYDNKNNIPDYLLSDANSMGGWDLVNIHPSLDDTITNDSDFYGGLNKKYNSSDAHNEFIKRLKISSNYIFSAKGTKNSIEMILALFGVPRDWYSIDEYVGRVNTTTLPPIDTVKKINNLKATYEDIQINDDDFADPLQGLPLIELTNGDTGEEIILPWYDKNQKIDGNPYYQMKGGWGEVEDKTVSVEIEKINGDSVIVNTVINSNDISIYDEHIKLIELVENTAQLLNVGYRNIKSGDIYFVSDVSDDPNTYVDPSRYYILLDRGKCNEISADGWYNIPQKTIIEAAHLTEYGKRVLYLESIIDDTEGNKPHTGLGEYDSGAEYLMYFRELFYYSLKNKGFDEAYIYENVDNVSLTGFGVKYEKSNKIGFFDDTWEGILDANSIINIKTVVFRNLVGDNADYNAYTNYLMTTIKNYMTQAIPSTIILIDDKNNNPNFIGKEIWGAWRETGEISCTPVGWDKGRVQKRVSNYGNVEVRYIVFEEKSADCGYVYEWRISDEWLENGERCNAAGVLNEHDCDDLWYSYQYDRECRMWWYCYPDMTGTTEKRFSEYFRAGKLHKKARIDGWCNWIKTEYVYTDWTNTGAYCGSNGTSDYDCEGGDTKNTVKYLQQKRVIHKRYPDNITGDEWVRDEYRPIGDAIIGKEEGRCGWDRTYYFTAWSATGVCDSVGTKDAYNCYANVGTAVGPYQTFYNLETREYRSKLPDGTGDRIETTIPVGESISRVGSEKSRALVLNKCGYRGPVDVELTSIVRGSTTSEAPTWIWHITDNVFITEYLDKGGWFWLSMIIDGPIPNRVDVNITGDQVRPAYHSPFSSYSSSDWPNRTFYGHLEGPQMVGVNDNYWSMNYLGNISYSPPTNHTTVGVKRLQEVAGSTLTFQIGCTTEGNSDFEVELTFYDGENTPFRGDTAGYLVNGRLTLRITAIRESDGTTSIFHPPYTYHVGGPPRGKIDGVEYAITYHYIS